MAYFAVRGIELRALSAAVPANEERNEHYTRLSHSELKLLMKTTGVEKRRVAPKGMATSDLCFEAAQKILKELEWHPSEVDLLIFISQSRDYYLPSTSAILQDRLGLSVSSMTFDIGLGCSGFVYGLSIAASLLQSTGFKKALVLSGDVSSATCSYNDKSTYPLFGDGGVACALENTGKDHSWHFDTYTDGSGHESIIIPDGGIRNLLSEASFENKIYSEGIERSRLNLALNGIDIFNFSISKIPQSIAHFEQLTGKNSRQHDYFIMHQANMLMNETIRKKTGFDASQVPYSIRDFGNTSSASIGLTMVTQLADQLRSKKLNLLLSGFGVGLSWANASITADSIVCPDLIEL